MGSGVVGIVSVLQDEKALEIHCTTWIYLTLLNYVLKNGYDGKFYVICFLLQLIIKEENELSA